jgi:hypothetical protein
MMIRRNKTFVNWLLMVALLAQALPVMAQDKLTKKPGPDLKPGAVAEAFLNVFPISLLRGEVEVSWKAGAPTGVSIKGFDVTLEIGFNDGKTQRLNRSVGGDVRTTTFTVKLPIPPKGGGEVGNNNGNNAGADIDRARCEIGCKQKKTGLELEKCLKQCASNANGDVTARKFGEGSISGGGKGGAASEPGGKEDGGFKPKPTADPAGVKTLRATVVGKFSGGENGTASREFATPADKATGELIPKAGQNRGGNNLALQINKLIHISEIAQRARECPAGQDCFEALGQARGGGQFKVSLDAVYKNGQRKTVSRLGADLSRPIPLNVDKPSNTELSSAIVTISAEAAGDFTKTDTVALGVLTQSPIGTIKK